MQKKKTTKNKKQKQDKTNKPQNDVYVSVLICTAVTKMYA